MEQGINDDTLINVHDYGMFMSGAMRMFVRLMEYELVSSRKKTKEDRIYDAATLRLISSGKDNAYRFITSGFDEIRFRNHERDKNGKLVSCEAYFAERK